MTIYIYKLVEKEMGIHKFYDADEKGIEISLYWFNIIIVY